MYLCPPKSGVAKIMRVIYYLRRCYHLIMVSWLFPAIWWCIKTYLHKSRPKSNIRSSVFWKIRWLAPACAHTLKMQRWYPLSARNIILYVEIILSLRWSRSLYNLPCLLLVFPKLRALRRAKSFWSMITSSMSYVVLGRPFIEAGVRKIVMLDDECNIKSSMTWPERGFVRTPRIYDSEVAKCHEITINSSVKYASHTSIP